MKLFGSLIYIVVLVICAGVIQSNAQTTPTGNAIPKIPKRLLSEIIRSKADKPFILLSPSDLADLSKKQSSTLSPADDPCTTAERIGFGQTVTGELANTDCQLDDGSYADFYYFDGLAGEQATSIMGSGVYYAYLGLANESGTWIVEDAGGVGVVPRIDVILPESGNYIILANSVYPSQFGGYTLKLRGGPDCAFTYKPDSADVPPEGGTFTFDVITEPRCYWAANSRDGNVSTGGEGFDNGTVSYSVTPNTRNQTRDFDVLMRDTTPALYQSGPINFHIRQAPISCSYAFDPPSINVGPEQMTGSISVTATSGCMWSASEVSDFVSASGWALGNGTVSYTVSHNNGSTRSGSIIIDGHTIPVTQTGLNCTYSVSPTQINVAASGLSGNYHVNTQPGCTWGLILNQPWIEMQAGLGAGTSTIPFHIPPLPDQSARSATIQFSYPLNSTGYTITTWVNQRPTRFATTAWDFDGDGKADYSLYRPSNGIWYLQQSTYPLPIGAQWGISTDKIVPADYDGDGKTDIAVFRPDDGFWYVLNSLHLTMSAFSFGLSTDIPLPGDFDGDGKADLNVYRPSNGTWYRQNSSDNTFYAEQFGTSEDKPQAGDFDGDGKADLAVFRPSNGIWYFNRSTAGLGGVQFGISTDMPVPADYDADGKTDIAVYRPSEGFWYRLNSSDGVFNAFQFGLATDLPAPADYDGDGKADICIWRPSDGNWWRISSATGAITAFQFGASGDKPVPSAYVY